jgi:hypothetical protein
VQILRGIAETGGELIEGRERRVDLVRRDIPFFHRADFAEANLAQLSRKRFVLRCGVPNDVDVFETGLTIEPQVRQVLAEESEAFAEKKDRDQRQHDDRDERVPTEEKLDALLDDRLRTARFPSGRNQEA